MENIEINYGKIEFLNFRLRYLVKIQDIFNIQQIKVYNLTCLEVWKLYQKIYGKVIFVKKKLNIIHF